MNFVVICCRYPSYIDMSKRPKMIGNMFNATYPNKKFYKLTNCLQGHNGFKLNTGLNVHQMPLTVDQMSRSHGLYFTESHNACYWYNYGQTCKYYREVTVPDDAVVSIGEKGFISDKIILSDAYEIQDREDICINILETCGSYLSHITKQTEKMCLVAVKQDGDSLQHVRVQTDEICREAIKQYSYALRFVTNQSEELCKFAISLNPYAIHSVRNQTFELASFAVSLNGNVIEVIRNKTLELCKLAVHQDKNSTRWINPSFKLS